MRSMATFLRTVHRSPWQAGCLSAAATEASHYSGRRWCASAPKPHPQQRVGATHSSAQQVSVHLPDAAQRERQREQKLHKKELKAAAASNALSKAERRKEALANQERKTKSVAVRAVPEGAYLSVRGVVSLADFKQRFGWITDAGSVPEVGASPPATAASSSQPSAEVTVAGRVASMRHMGKVMFLTIRSNNETLQLVLRAGDGALDAKGIKDIKEELCVGDVVAVDGIPGRTRLGEMSLFGRKRPRIVAPYVSTDLVSCPDMRGFASIQEPEIKYRYRFLDMLSSDKTVDTFVTRHKILMSLRQFLTTEGFVEVETPTFHTIPGGAAATPFATRHHATDSDLYLRVAPELYLKQLVVGGMERVFEVGRVFRNEDADYSHNPEFTSCEFYQAYATYEDLMVTTEHLLRTVAKEATGSAVVQVRRSDGSLVPVDFAKPFTRVRVMPTLEERLGVTFPPLPELDTPRGVEFLTKIFNERQLQLPSVLTAAKLVDKLIDRYITDDVIEPTFVTDHPVFMSPLAKAHADGSHTSERFELFINGMEICNAYSELTDPVEQYKRFEQQMRQREMGDCESQSIDDTFLKALQVGLPPTAGWGMGIDRLCMLLTGSQSIRDVIMFPLMRPDSARDARRRAKSASFFGFDQHMTSFVLKSLEAELERRGEVRFCNQLRGLRQTLEATLRAHDVAGHCAGAAKTGPMRFPCAPGCASVDLLKSVLGSPAITLLMAMMCPPPMR